VQNPKETEDEVFRSEEFEPKAIDKKGKGGPSETTSD